MNRGKVYVAYFRFGRLETNEKEINDYKYACHKFLFGWMQYAH